MAIGDINWCSYHRVGHHCTIRVTKDNLSPIKCLSEPHLIDTYESWEDCCCPVGVGPTDTGYVKWCKDGPVTVEHIATAKPRQESNTGRKRMFHHLFFFFLHSICFSFWLHYLYEICTIFICSWTGSRWATPHSEKKQMFGDTDGCGGDKL